MRAGESEVEPTAVAALALRDDAARAWLTRRQRPDGGFRAPSGRPESPTDAALAALALDGAAASRSLRYAVAHRGLPIPGEGRPDATRVGVDGGRPHLRGAHVPRADRGQAGDAVRSARPRRGPAGARGASVRRRRLESRDRDDSREGLSRLRADDRDRARGTARRTRPVRAIGPRVPPHGMASGARRPHGRAGARRVQVARHGRRGRPRGRRARSDRAASVVPRPDASRSRGRRSRPAPTSSSSPSGARDEPDPPTASRPVRRRGRVGRRRRPRDGVQARRLRLPAAVRPGRLSRPRDARPSRS